jgi:hypothetical protein
MAAFLSLENSRGKALVSFPVDGQVSGGNVSPCGRVDVWACGRVGVWACGRVGVWAFSHPARDAPVHTFAARMER